MADRYNAILLFGAPGVGKGTQGKLLGQIPGMKHLATGDMFRSMDKNSELGRKIGGYMSRGELVPDDLTIELWKQHVQNLVRDKKFSPKHDVLVLDGIPRSRNQAKAIDPYINVLRVVHLTAPDIDEMVRRMKKRALKENRPDDADESVIRRRFEVYDAETHPVLAHYDRKFISDVNAIGTPAAVLMHALEAIVPAYDKCCGNPLNG
jgi:adenylate kinase